MLDQAPHRSGRGAFPHPVLRDRTFPYDKVAGETPQPASHVSIRTQSCTALRRCVPRGWRRVRARSPSRLHGGAQVTPGFPFARPGPTDGVGSLASRPDRSPRRRTARPARPGGVFVGTQGERDACHRYYGLLRLPNALPRFLCGVRSSPRTCRLRVDSQDRPGGAAGLSWGALVSRWTPRRGRLRADPRLVETGS